MPTYTVGPGKTYSTIQAAVDATPFSLPGTGIHFIDVDAGGYTEVVTIPHNGATTSDYVHIRAAAGAEHKFNLSAGVRLVRPNSAGTGAALIVESRHACCSDMIVSRPTVGAQIGPALDFGPILGDGGTMRNMVFISPRTGVFLRWKFSSGNFYNCLAINPSGSDSSNPGFHNSQGTGVFKFINCGSFGFAPGFLFSDNFATVKNCWAYKHSGASADLFSGMSTPDTASNNAGNDASAPGANSIQLANLAAFGFVDSDNLNFHLQSGSELIGAGSDQSALFTADVDHEVIEDWSIGPDAKTLPPVPVLISPEDGETEVHGFTRFTWEPAEGASEYEIQVSKSEGFSPLAYTAEVAGTKAEAILEWETEYFWRARANVSESLSEWSEPNRFTTTNPGLVRIRDHEARAKDLLLEQFKGVA